MAFRDIKVVLYDGKIQIDYKDKSHTYYKRERVDFALPETDPKAWGPATGPKGTTTLLGDTLEKKGLMTWPMGLALTEMFGFYDFTNDQGERMTGFSKKNGGGTLWGMEMFEANKGAILDLVLSASKAWQRKQKQGADIGSLVHDAIEQFVLGTPFALTLERYEQGQLWWDGTGSVATEQEKIDREAWLKIAPAELEMAKLAYERFKVWWAQTSPALLEAENIVYSMEHNYCGSYDARLAIAPQHHPVYFNWDRPIRVMTDWKTSKASVAGGAPEGIYYSYFAQDAAYAKALYEMTGELVDDLLVVSARKDGGFTALYASELGLTVPDCIAWWDAIVLCYRTMDKTKRALAAHAEANLEQATTSFSKAASKKEQYRTN